MILVVTNAEDATADFFLDRMTEHKVPFVRLDTECFANHGIDYAVSDGTPTGSIEIMSRVVELKEITAVYYRRPRPATLPDVDDAALRMWMQNEFRQAWGGVLMAEPGVRWVNHPIAISAASFKPEQLARAARLGFRVPDTLVTTNPDAARRFCEARDWNVVAKPVGHGEIRRDGAESDELVYTNLVDETCRSALDDVRHCPTLLQACLSKHYDIRVTVAGADCIAVALHSQEKEFSRIDCRRDNMRGMRYSAVDLPAQLVERLTTLVQSYGLNFAAIDLVLDSDGKYWFLELNAAGQWAWLEELTGVRISESLIRCLTAR